MTEGNFVDYVKIHVTSGNGGKGSTHFHREKYITKGGPDGGDGGRGGHVIVRGDKNLWTLVNFKYKRHFKAAHGGHGSKSRSTGADGDDMIIPVPLHKSKLRKRGYNQVEKFASESHRHGHNQELQRHQRSPCGLLRGSYSDCLGKFQTLSGLDVHSVCHHRDLDFLHP